MASNDAGLRTARQYRPSYSYKYTPPIPSSKSMTFSEPIGEAWPSNHVVSPPIVDFPTDLATHRLLRAAQIAAKAANNTTNTSTNRRRTDPSFTRPFLGHSAPTVANSSLTASASGNDLSQPTPKSQRSRFPNLRRGGTPSRSSKIPSPIFGTKARASPVRYVSTPVLPSQKSKKENVPPSQTHRLLGPISPTRQQPMIPRSRTMGMLSTLTSSFSRSNLSVSSRQVSASSAFSSDPTLSISTTSSPPLPTFTTNIRQVHTAQPINYWCGRFQTLSDNFQNEDMEAAILDPSILDKYFPNRVQSPALSSITNMRFKGQRQGRAKEETYDQRIERESRTQVDIDRLMAREEEQRNKRVLMHLEALCVTNEARKSLWEFQLGYARTARNEKYLPAGGRMTGEKGGWVSRLGRTVSGMTTSGTMSSLGSRSRLGGLGRRKESVLGLGERARCRQYQQVY